MDHTPQNCRIKVFRTKYNPILNSKFYDEITDFFYFNRKFSSVLKLL